jgi:hypothetical protein
MTDARRDLDRPAPDGRWTADGRFMTVYRAGEDPSERRGPRRPAGTAVARPAGRTASGAESVQSARPGGRTARKRTRGVTAGRVVAAGAGIAAMLGLVAQMQVAGNAAAAAAPAPVEPAGPVPTSAQLRSEQNVRMAAVAVAEARKPIVLTPHTIVNTVGGGSSGGYSGGYAAAAPSYSAPAAPVASSGGSAPH